MWRMESQKWVSPGGEPGGDDLKDPPEIPAHAPQGSVTLISVDSRSNSEPRWIEMSFPGGSVLENSPAMQKMQV